MCYYGILVHYWSLLFMALLEHEDKCPHVLKLMNTYDAEKPSPPPVRTCGYREHGCLFIGHTEQGIFLLSLLQSPLLTIT